MQIKYDHTFGLPRKIIWKYLKDADILKNAIPGCKEFAETSNGIYKGKMEISVGPIKDEFDLEVRRLKEKSPNYYQLGVKVKGNLGEINAKADLFLKDLQPFTGLSQVTEATVTGAIALAGERILESSAKKNFQKFFQGIEIEIKKSLYKQKHGN